LLDRFREAPFQKRKGVLPFLALRIIEDMMTAQEPETTHSSVQKPFRFPHWVHADWFRCLLIGLIGFVVRLPGLQGEPIWDDDYLVRTNPFIKSPLLIFETFRHYLFQDTFTAAYRPVQNLSYLLDYAFWNSNFYGYHLTSLLCHILSGILLYLLLRHLLTALHRPSGHPASAIVTPPVGIIAFLIALLWVVHPVHSAAIDYVSGRADSLAFLFACGAWLLCLRARSATPAYVRWPLYVAAWLAGLLALCSRETGLVWAAIFLVYTIGFDRTTNRRAKWFSVAGCGLVVGVYYFLRTLPGPPSMPNDPSDVTPPLFRIVLMLRSLADYARLTVFPSNLHMERTVYDFKAYQSETARWSSIGHEYLTIFGLLVLIGLIFNSVRPGRGRPLRVFGTVWFFIAYLPISNLITLNATVAEHWLYLPSVGLLLFLVGCGLDLPVRFHRAAGAFACAVMIGFGVRSVYRSSDWTSNETFARRTMASGGATMRVVLLLAQSYASRGDYVAAERLLRRAVQLSPNYPMARNNLADALAHEGREKEAEALLAHSSQSAVTDRKAYPRTWIAAVNLSQLLHKDHDDTAAIAVLEKARHDYPITWDLISAEAELLREADRAESALPLIERFARDNWWHYRAWGAYGRLLAQVGDNDRAAAALRHASWLDIHETSALNMMALIRMRQNRLEEALQTQERAVARQPDEPRQYLLLSTILEKMGHADEARTALAQVTHLRDLAGSKTAQN
jgi:Flp pilus assembly protein TadD